MPISMSKDLNFEIERETKKSRYGSKSEYIRRVVMDDLAWRKSFKKREKKAIAEGLKAIKEGRISKAFNSREAMKFLSRL